MLSYRNTEKQLQDASSVININYIFMILRHFEVD